MIAPCGSRSNRFSPSIDIISPARGAFHGPQARSPPVRDVRRRRSGRRRAGFRLRPGPRGAGVAQRFAGRRGIGERSSLHERRDGDLRGDRVSPADVGDGRARCADRGSEHRRAGPGGRQRRLWRPAQRGRRGAARRVLHARTEAAGRRGRGARRSAHAIQCGAEGRRPDRPSPAGRGRRATVRAAAWLHCRGRPQYRPLAPDVAGMEAPHRSRPLPRSGPDRRRQRGRCGCRGARARRRQRDAGRRRHHRRGALRHDQLRRHQRGGRNLRSDHDERSGLERSRAG